MQQYAYGVHCMQNWPIIVTLAALGLAAPEHAAPYASVPGGCDAGARAITMREDTMRSRRLGPLIRSIAIRSAPRGGVLTLG